MKINKCIEFGANSKILEREKKVRNRERKKPKLVRRKMWKWFKFKIWQIWFFIDMNEWMIPWALPYQPYSNFIIIFLLLPYSLFILPFPNWILCFNSPTHNMLHHIKHLYICMYICIICIIFIINIILLINTRRCSLHLLMINNHSFIYRKDTILIDDEKWDYCSNIQKFTWDEYSYALSNSSTLS